jgi:hypothetical protein
MPIRQSTCVLLVPLLLLGLVLLVGAGCAGGVEITGLDATPVQHDPPPSWPPPNNNPPNNYPPPGDSGNTAPVSADAKPPANADGGSPPPPAPDAGTQQTQTNPNAGKPCPCTVNGACRATCSAPTDVCKAVSNCGTSEACVQTTKPGIWVCLPALAPGAICGMLKPCPVKTVCTSISGAAYKCLPVCAVANAPCGTTGAGKCAQFKDGCKVCSQP